MKNLIFMLILLLVPACNPVMNNFIAAKKVEDGSAKKSSDSDDDAERVDIPNNITGSYLMCSLRKDATATDVASEYGCRLNEAGTTNKLDLSLYQNRLQWKSSPEDGVVILQNPGSSVWHALYTVSSGDLATLREKTARLQIQVQWSLPSGNEQATFKNQKLTETLQPADVAGDTGAPILQGQGLDPTDPGTL